MKKFIRYTATKFAGYLGRKKIPLITQNYMKIFVRYYKVNMQEALEPKLSKYRTFNQFFTRTLKQGIRPIDERANSLVSPADGRLTQIGVIDDGKLIQAKDHLYELYDLLGDDEQAAIFENGFFSKIYLSPKDYHRVHMPLAGQCYQATYIPGQLLPVKLKVVNKKPDLFANNERVIAYFDTAFGKMAVIMVGAIVVGSIELVWQGVINASHKGSTQTWHYKDPICLAKGEEMGRFNIGSTVIVLCENQPSHYWKEHLTLKGKDVHYGEAVAEWTAF